MKSCALAARAAASTCAGVYRVGRELGRGVFGAQSRGEGRATAPERRERVVAFAFEQRSFTDLPLQLVDLRLKRRRLLPRQSKLVVVVVAVEVLGQRRRRCRQQGLGR